MLELMGGAHFVHSPAERRHVVSNGLQRPSKDAPHDRMRGLLRPGAWPEATTAQSLFAGDQSSMLEPRHFGAFLGEHLAATDCDPETCQSDKLPFGIAGEVYY